ncbi:MAG: TraR/DksA family transcriptional regulator [Actinomycetota bacterium]|nr:TraR/DksA family transcriptional regulator [Actinomycetota bacterium]
MDDERARTLLETERRRLETLIAGTDDDSRSDRDEEDAPGDMSDPAERLTAEGTDDAVAAGLRARLDAVERAEQRLAAGTFGTSVRSGKPIPDERLEADPAAELTVDEASDDGTAVG